MSSVLIVDDDVAVLHLYDAILSDIGFDVFAAASVDETLKMMETIRPDMLMVDLIMPSLSGVDLIAKVRVGDKTTPIVMVTGSGDQEIINSGFKNGASDLLEKPFEEKQLFRMLQKHIPKLKKAVGEF